MQLASKILQPQIQINSSTQIQIQSPMTGHLQFSMSRISSASSQQETKSPIEKQPNFFRPNIKSNDQLVDPGPMSGKSRRGEQQVDLKIRFQSSTSKLLSILHEQKFSSDIVSQTKAALLKIVHSRTEEDFQKIESFMLRLVFMQKLREDHGMHLVGEFCKNLYYRRSNEGEEVIHINREGKTFYVILQGFVDVFIFKPKNDYALQLQKKFAKSQDDSLLNYDDPLLFERSLIRTLGQGDSFGEYSLLDQKYRTTATIITKSECEFTCLDRKQYWNILGKIKRGEIEEKLKFIHKLQIFQGWSDQDLRTISYHFENLIFNKDNKILIQGRSNKDFYFISQGQFVVLKNHRDEEKETAFLAKFKPSRTVSVSLIGYGEIFGQDEYIGCSRSSFSVNCTLQNSSVYKISYHDLSKRLWDTEQRDRFYDYVKEQFQRRFQRYQQIKLISLAQIEKATDNKDIIELHSKSLEKINKLKQQDNYSPYQIRQRDKSPTFKKVNFDQSYSFQKLPMINEPLQNNVAQNESLTTSREQSRLRPRIVSQHKVESAKQSLEKQAQNALKRGKIERFLKNEDEVEPNYDINVNKLGIVPRISTRVRGLCIDYMDAVAGFDKLSDYQLTSRNNFRMDNTSSLTDLEQKSSRSVHSSPLRNLEQPGAHLNPVGLNIFLKFAAMFKNTDLSRIASSFYNLVWRKKTQLSFELNLKLFQKEIKDVRKSQIVELLKFYLDKTFTNLNNSRVPAQHIDYEVQCIKQVIERVCQRESKQLYV